MRKSISAAAAAALMLMGCSGSSSSSSSSGTTGASTTTAGSTGTSGSSGSVSTSGSSGSTSTSGSSASTGSSGSSASSGSSGSSSTGGSSGSSGSTGTSGDFSCLGTPTPPTLTGTSVTVTVTFKDAAGGNTAPAGITVNACDATAADCSTPLATATTNSSGTAVLTINGLTAGSTLFAYLDANDTGTPNSFMLPTLVYLPPLGDNFTFNDTTVSSTDLGIFSALLGGATLDTTTHGIILGSTTDCSGNPVAGAKITTSSTDNTTHVYYVAGSTPSATASATDASGDYAISNVPADPQFIVTATNSANQPYEIDQVITKAGTATTIIGVPNQ